MKVNAEAIYGTQPDRSLQGGQDLLHLAPGRDGLRRSTSPTRTRSAPPSKIMLTSIAPAEGTSVRMLGVREPVRWEKVGKGALLTVPPAAVAKPPCRDAWVFKFKPAAPRKGAGS